MEEDRSPIWTIPRSEITAFFAYFTVLNILGLSFVAWHESVTNQDQGILNIIRVVIENAGSITAGSAGIAIAASEITRWGMVIASYFRDKYLIPQREKLRDEGRREMAAMWQEWDHRRKEALARGEDFNEPPPGAK